MEFLNFSELEPLLLNVQVPISFSADEHKIIGIEVRPQTVSRINPKSAPTAACTNDAAASVPFPAASPRVHHADIADEAVAPVVPVAADARAEKVKFKNYLSLSTLAALWHTPQSLLAVAVMESIPRA